MYLVLDHAHVQLRLHVFWGVAYRQDLQSKTSCIAQELQVTNWGLFVPG